MRKQFILKGFLKKYDDKKIYLDFISEDIDVFTKNFLQNYFPTGNTPIYGQEFHVKLTKNNKFYLNKTQEIEVGLEKLLDNIVELGVEIKHYKFNSNGKQIVGWYINLLYMYLLT